jgi:hypothetical protein
MPLIDLNPVPKSISPLQARRALRATGLHTFVEDWLEAGDDETKEAWAYAVEIRRDDAIVAAAAQAMGLTESDLDDLFRLASTL